MTKKKIGIIVAIAAVLGLAFVVDALMDPDEYVPADDEIALNIQLDTEEAVGSLGFDYCAGGHTYSGGVSNTDGSPLKNDSEIMVVWNKEEFNDLSEDFELSIQFQIITENMTPNYEKDFITECMEPISWEAHFGESYFITITGDQDNGYKATFNSKN